MSYNQELKNTAKTHQDDGECSVRYYVAQAVYSVPYRGHEVSIQRQGLLAVTCLAVMLTLKGH